MKIAVSASGWHPAAAVVPQFGRCAGFVVYDTDDRAYSTVMTASRRRVGAGLRVAHALVNNGVEVVITGNIGPHAFNVLRTAGVRCYLTMNGTVKDCLAAYETGQLKEINAATVPQYAGVVKAGR
ncbi:MAG: dinitrogenase iron-molybdenum cofactor biosynthesis protein [Ammonifex sp.]|nr:MAG: dinitrogenase iron-molybdenum cofactor biosynthesis protein [Ammonifex sp.]